jgi:hypothetical protein
MSIISNIWKRIVLSIFSIIQRNYYVAKYLYINRHQRELAKANGSPIVIYQMGKVGSKTIKKSLEALNLNVPIYHTHLLTWNRIKETEKERKKYFGTSRIAYLKRPWLNTFLRKQLDKGLDGKRWKIVSLTRESIGRNISTFFENLKYRELVPGKKWEIRSDYYNINATEVTLDDFHILEGLFFSRLKHDTPVVFFDQELKEVLGVDVFLKKFPKDKGYNIYHSNQVDVLLIRLENLNECVNKAFKEFLSIDNFTLVNTNTGSSKVYAELYNKFKEKIRFSTSYLNKMYTSKYMQHFYSEEEISKFSKKWHGSTN